MELIIFCLIIIFVLIVYCYYICYDNDIYIISDIDNNNYLIRNGKNKSKRFLKESANILARINININKMINHLCDNYIDDQNYNYFIRKLRDNYNYSILSEASVDNRYTTYTINKESMHVCLRTRDQLEELYDMNLLMYVLLHENSHLCNYTRNGIPIEGHGSEFKMIFKFLIQEAIKIGVYTYEDYTSNPREYCGIKINTNIMN